MVLPFGLCNTAMTVRHLVAQHMIPFLMNNEFIWVIEHVAESLHDLIVEEPGSPFGSDSSRGSHHPSQECFMTGTSEGHIKSISEVEATPANNLSKEAKGETTALPRMQVEKLKARH